MPIELSYLTAAIALFFAHLLAEVVAGNIQYSAKDLLGARDDLAPNNAVMARTKRATQNMLEALIMFAPLVLVAHATGNLNEMTTLGAGIFLASRLVYAPSYWLGIPVIRTLAWFGGLIGIIMIFFQVLPFSGAA